ncbi:MAG: SRPBCC family protein [Acidimicrobiales bacterium]
MTIVDIAADRQTVFDFLTEPRTYPDWLVGAQDMRAVESAWPSPGARFHHRVGVGPFHIDDSTTVLAVDPPDSLVLRASIGPLGTALVSFRLEGDGVTRLTMDERPDSGLVHLLGTAGSPLLRASIWSRNRVALNQLKGLIEAPKQGAPADGT